MNPIPTNGRTGWRQLSLVSLLLLTSTYSFAQSPSELDKFLASPTPKGAISESIAREKVEKGNALAAAAPNRSQEIQAYLIPFQRVLGTPADQQPAAAPASAIVAKPKPFLIFKSSEGVAECFKADSYSTEGDFMIAQTLDGKKGMWPKARYETQLPWYQDEEMDQGSVDLEALALRYKVSISVYPAITSALQGEMDRIQAIIQKHHQAAEEKINSLQSKAAAVIAHGKTYSVEKEYTREELASMLLNAEAARRDLPDQAQKIDAAMAPFRTHFENLLANRVYSEGSWQNKADVEAKIASKQLEREVAALEKNTRLEINAVSLSTNEVQALLGAFGILGVGMFGWGIKVLISKPTLPSRALGAVFCLAPATLGIYGTSLLSPSPANAPSFASEKPPGVNKVLRVLYLASKPSTTPLPQIDRRITLREADLNSFLRDYVKVVGAPESADWGIYRTDLAVQLQSDGITVWELAQFKGKNLRIRYDFKLDGIGSEVKISSSKVTIGSLPAPGPIKEKMVNHLLPELAKINLGTSALEAFKITRLTEGELDLTSTR